MYLGMHISFALAVILHCVMLLSDDLVVTKLSGVGMLASILLLVALRKTHTNGRSAALTRQLQQERLGYFLHQLPAGLYRTLAYPAGQDPSESYYVVSCLQSYGRERRYVVLYHGRLPEFFELSPSGTRMIVDRTPRPSVQQLLAQRFRLPL